MRVLICGGKKTDNIISVLTKKYNSGNIAIIGQSSIVEIGNVFERGDYFDRAIIIDKGLTDSNSVDQDDVIRQRLRDFVELFKNKCNKHTTLVFVCFDEHIATIISDETIEISPYLKILIREGKLDIGFFSKIITLTLDALPQNIVFSVDKIQTKQNNVIQYTDKREASAKVSDLSSAKEVNIDDLIKQQSKTQNTQKKSIDIDNAFYDEDDYEEYDEENIPDDSLMGIKLEDDNMDEDGNIEEAVNNIEIHKDIEFDTIKEPELAEIDNEESVDYNNIDFSSLGEIEMEEVVAEEVVAEDEENVSNENNSLYDTDFYDNSLIGTNETLEEFSDGITEHGLIEDNLEEELKEKDLEEQEEHIEPIEQEDIEFSSKDILNSITEDDIDLSSFGVEDIKLEEEIVVNDNPLDGIQDLFATPAETVTNNSVEDLFNNVEESPISNKEVLNNFNKEDIVPTKTAKKGLFKSKKQVEIPKQPKVSSRKSIDNTMQKLQTIMSSYRSRGCSIVFTGCSNSGKTTVSYNLAKLISEMNYNVLLVDFDTLTKGQGLISRQSFDAVHSMDAENASLKQAINANAHITNYTNIVQPGFHLLTMGLAGDISSVENLVNKQKIAKFSSNVRNSYNFIIYDIPFQDAISHCEDVTSTADSLVLMSDYSTKGLMELLVLMSNIDTEEMTETLFTRSMLCFNKFNGFEKMFDKKVRRTDDVLREMDNIIKDLLGAEAEYSFRDIHQLKPLNYDNRYNDCWLSQKAFIDYADGKMAYVDLLEKVLLNDWRD